MTKLLKRCWVILAFLVITAAVISSLFRALTPWAKQYKADVEQHLSLMFGQNVTITAMETGWYWFEPVIKLNQISISDGNKERVKLSNLLIGINIFSSLWHWQIQPGVLLIEDLNLGLHQEKGEWQIDGLDSLDQHLLTWDAATAKTILAWVLGQDKIIIKNLSAHIYMEDGTFIPLSQLSLNIAHHSGRYHVKGKGRLAQATPTNFQLDADLALNPYALQKSTGHVFFTLKHLLPAQWQGLMPNSRFQPQDGQGSLQLWADIDHGKLKLVQSRLRLHHLSWFDKETQKNQLIQTFKANLAWKPTEKGWQLTADQVHLSLGDRRWPENSFLIRYVTADDAYFVFVKNILLESLLTTSLNWPETLKPVLAKNPHGYFHDTKLRFKPSGIDYVLTRFSDLGWQKPGESGFDNLSGALYWQPKEGQLEIAGEKILISPKNQKPIELSAVDSAFHWQKKAEGLRIHVERLVVNHPNFLLSIRGLIDKISNDSSGQLNLTGLFEANNAHQLLPYLPSAYLKPKLEAWLKQDIKRIKHLNGNLVINGAAADFPYDNQPGEFAINTHLQGVDLVFAPKWSPAEDIDAYLNIDKRNLIANVVQANLQGIPAKKTTVRVDDIGLDREILYVRTSFDTKANQALNYIRSSPLNKKLSALSLLEMKGSISLDLQLEAPLYPEDNEILGYGELNFKNNQIALHHSLDDIDLRKLTGALHFNQNGILDSDLKTDILNCPTNLAVRSIHETIPYTEIKLSGQATAEVLSKKLNLPNLGLLNGSLWMQSTLKLTDDPDDLDHLRVQTSLEGLSMDLPPPLGKAASSKRPLTLDIDFNSQKAVRLRLNYDNNLNSDLWFSRLKGAFELQKGEIRIGGGEISQQKIKGLQITGSLPYFDLQQWLELKAKLPKSQDKSIIVDALNRIDLKFKRAKIWKENYKDLAIRAKKLADNDWSIQFKQAKIAANLNYQPHSNTLSGQFDTLKIENSKLDNKSMTDNSTLKPTDLPNLDLRIASLHWGSLDLGDMNLKTQSTPKLWKLDYCKIQTPSYFLNLKGEWKQEGKKNSTTMQANMQIADLASSLQRWKITPAVEARQGDLQFAGGWKGSLFDFQLSKIEGQIKMDFKNGRITNLSPETEEKLGLGKLLSILSLQTIPRRLKLDFSDLAKTGYSFDKFQGNFDLSDGIMKTKDSYIDGPVAYASMKGNLDVAKQHYDVDLKISPHITASLPIVATIAGGPIVGFATWVASRLINQGMHKISGYSYKVTGPWQKPLVEQVSIIKKKLTRLST